MHLCDYFGHFAQFATKCRRPAGRLRRCSPGLRSHRRLRADSRVDSIRASPHDGAVPPSFTTLPDTPTVRLVRLSPDVLSALLDDALDRARVLAGIDLTEYFASPSMHWLWTLRLDQIAADPSSRPWLVRAGVDSATSQVVGHAGFHGPPDSRGMVEVGYSVDPLLRRRGYARAMLQALIGEAGCVPGVTTVRASISPTNVASRATIARFGFEQVGEQWDDRDGLELVFERRLPSV